MTTETQTKTRSSNIIQHDTHFARRPVINPTRAHDYLYGFYIFCNTILIEFIYLIVYIIKNIYIYIYIYIRLTYCIISAV